MRSRTVQPVRRRGQKNSGRDRRRRRSSLGDTQPLRPVNPSAGRRVSGDTEPMPVIRQYSGGYAGEGQYGGRGQESGRSDRGRYQRMMEQRRRVVRTPRPQAARSAAGRRPQPSALSSVIHRLRHGTQMKEQYFDFDLLLIVVFLMCFGLVMLYSTSAYSAQLDFDNDMYYFRSRR